MAEDRRKVTVLLRESTYEVLTEIARREDRSQRAVVERAILLYAGVDEAKKEVE